MESVRTLAAELAAKIAAPVFLQMRWTYGGILSDKYIPTEEQLKEVVASLLFDVPRRGWQSSSTGRFHVRRDELGDITISLDLASFPSDRLDKGVTE